jgi:hypothetical protein
LKLLSLKIDPGAKYKFQAYEADESKKKKGKQ